MVQAADVLPLVAKDGALPLIDLGRLALTTSRAISARPSRATTAPARGCTF